MLKHVLFYLTKHDKLKLTQNLTRYGKFMLLADEQFDTETIKIKCIETEPRTFENRYLPFNHPGCT